MATTRLPTDFKEFLQLLNLYKVKYLLVGGYAVGYHGYHRATLDMNIWVDRTPLNAKKLVSVLKKFGFEVAASSTPHTVFYTDVGPIKNCGIIS